MPPAADADDARVAMGAMLLAGLGTGTFLAGVVALVLVYVGRVRRQGMPAPLAALRYFGVALAAALLAYGAGTLVGIAAACSSTGAGNLCGIVGVLGSGPLCAGIGLIAYAAGFGARMLGGGPRR